MLLGDLCVLGEKRSRFSPGLRCGDGFCDFSGINDDGFTFLPGGRRLSKADPLLDALGSLDELNAALGMLRAALESPPDAALIESLQKQVLAIGGELATGQPRLAPDVVAALEAETARRAADLPPHRTRSGPRADGRRKSSLLPGPGLAQPPLRPPARPRPQNEIADPYP